MSQRTINVTASKKEKGIKKLICNACLCTAYTVNQGLSLVVHLHPKANISPTKVL